MPTNFPTSLDSVANLPTTIADATAQVTVHSAYHDTANGAAVAIETKLGIGASTPTAGLTLVGGSTAGTSSWVIPEGVTGTKTAAYSALATDGFIPVDATSGAVTVTLPTAVGITGIMITVKRINSGANLVTIATTSSQTIDGATTYLLENQWDSITCKSNGTNWWVK